MDKLLEELLAVTDGLIQKWESGQPIEIQLYYVKQAYNTYLEARTFPVEENPTDGISVGAYGEG